MKIPPVPGDLRKLAIQLQVERLRSLLEFHRLCKSGVRIRYDDEPVRANQGAEK